MRLPCRRRSASSGRHFRMRLFTNITLVLSLAVVMAVGIGTLLWLEMGRPSMRSVGAWTASNTFDFAKVVLTLVGGIGAVAALVIAYRKQHLGEAAERREDVKLFAERFTKAADQLGSDKAAVRLAGMYALEGLAQGAPLERQTIVNVLCAYLRMPDDEMGPQEQQVRLTAQAILAAHLRPGPDPAQPAETFWPDIDLDLTGAALLDFGLSDCHLHTARFNQARFSGDTSFYQAQFSGNAWFYQTQFSRDVRFVGARFSGITSFVEARFGRAVNFDKAQFGGNAGFGGASFDGARVRVDVPDGTKRTWPVGYAVSKPATLEEALLADTEGRWGYLVSTGDQEALAAEQTTSP